MYQMFQQGGPQIIPGSTLYYFNRNQMDASIANVVSVSHPHTPKASQANPLAIFSGLVVDLTLSVGNETISVEFPTGSTFANYPERGFMLSFDSAAVDREIDTIENGARQIIAQYPVQQQVLEKCGPLRAKIHPERQQAAAQDQKLASMEAKIDQMFAFFSAGVSGKGPAPKKKEE